jgi:hypothetical protein
VFNGASGTPTTNMAARPTSLSFLVVGTAAPGGAVNVHVHPDVQPGTGTSAHPFAPVTTSQPVSLATNGSLALQPAFYASASGGTTAMTLNTMVIEQIA